MKHIMTTTMVAAIWAFAFATTFEQIKLDTPVLSEDDPLGVTAIQQAQSNITTIEEKANSLETTVAEVKNTVTNTISTTTVDGKKKIQLTGDVVVIGNVKDGNTDTIMKADTNSILFAVNRDMDNIPIENGTIKFDADNIKFPVANDIWFGDSTLATILSNAGKGEVNTIVTVKTNGVALIPDSNRAIDITIPLQDYVKLSDLQDGITFDTMTVSNLTINGKKPSLEGHVHDDKLDATNGVAFGDLKVYPMPSGIVGQTHTIITHESMSIGDVEYKEDEITYSGETYKFISDTNGIARMKDVHSATNGLYQTMTNEFVKLVDLKDGITFDTISVTNLTIDGKKPSLEGHTHAVSEIDGLDSYKNPTISSAALEAINGINNSEDISAIKSSLTNFLHQFVIQSP